MIWAVDAEMGEMKWSYKTDDRPCQPPMLSTNGMLYFQDLGGNAYAIKAYEKPGLKIVPDGSSGDNGGHGVIDEDAYVVIGGIRMDKNVKNNTLSQVP